MEDDSNTLRARMAVVKGITRNSACNEDAVDGQILKARKCEAHQSARKDDE